MVAYLLCAGFGTRMGEYTDEVPKSLLRVGGRPILDYLVDDLLEWRELEAVHVVANERDYDAFLSWASGWSSTLDAKGISLDVHNDETSDPSDQLGAVGDLGFLLEKTGRPTDGALVSGGDSVYRFSLVPILNTFDGHTSRVLALHEPDQTLRRQSSTLVLDDHRVVDLCEEPADAESEQICPSWYLLTPSSLEHVHPYLQEGRDPDTLGTFVKVLAQKQCVKAVTLPNRPHLRLHCNTPDDLEHARAVLRSESRLLLDSEDVQRFLSP